MVKSLPGLTDIWQTQPHSLTDALTNFLNVIGKDTCSLRNKRKIAHLKQISHSGCTCSSTFLPTAECHRLAHLLYSSSVTEFLE